LAAKLFVKSGNNMSRIGNQPIIFEDKIAATLNGDSIMVKGPLGELSLTIPKEITPKLEGNVLTLARRSNTPPVRSVHGLTRALVQNMVEGVTKGFERRLELVGTGYRVAQQGAGLTISVGFSHPVIVNAEAGITLKAEGNNVIVVTGIKKQQVGQVAANIRKVRVPEPYNGKGIRYQGEVVRRKAGKAAKVGA
jgi:large subunit ribosomal protein L6